MTPCEFEVIQSNLRGVTLLLITKTFSTGVIGQGLNYTSVLPSRFSSKEMRQNTPLEPVITANSNINGIKDVVDFFMY